MAPLRIPAALLAALVLSLLAAALPPSAGAAQPCWQRLIADWTDGSIDHAYPARCYGQALANANQDLLDYSSFPDDVHRAMLAAAGGHVPAGQVGEQGGPRYASAVRSQRRPATGEPDIHHRDDDTAMRSSDGGWQASSIVHATASSLPLPLVALVVAGLVLVLSGAGGALSRRLRRTRRARWQTGR